MTTYIKRQIQIEANQDLSGSNSIFKRGNKVVKFDAVATLNEGGLRKFVIPIPTTNKDLMDGDEITTGKILYIETDTALTVKLISTSDTGIVVTPVVAADSGLDSKPGVLYLEGSFTHVYISVAGASGNANVVAGIIGA